jgi:hypothetical protein
MAVSPMELDEALSFAVILAWDDLFKGIQPHFVRIEYSCKPEQSLDYLSVWSVKGGGYEDLVCNWSMSPSSDHPRRACFANGFGSDELAQALEFIMNSQENLTRRAAACAQAFVLVYPPDADHRSAAAPWRVKATEKNRHSWGTPKVSAILALDEEAFARMEGEGYPSGLTTSVPDAMGHSG